MENEQYKLVQVPNISSTVSHFSQNSSDRYIPPEIVREILLKLHAQSLLRFAAVCKSWRSLITSTQFISAHLAQTPHSNTLLVRHYVRNSHKERYSLFQDFKNRPFYLNFTSELHFPFKCQQGYFRIIGSYNGIVCLSDDLFGELRSLVLWNPSIHKFISLPLPLIKPLSHYMTVLGFGADLPETGDYKLVRLVYRKNNDVDGPPEIEIYSINSGVWRRVVGVEIKHHRVSVMWSQAFVSGAVHWSAYDVVPNDGGIRSLVMTFSIANEVFGEIMLPDALFGVFPTNLSIMLFEESLAAVEYALDGGSCEVWVMKQYGVLESWSRLYRINLNADLKKVVGFKNNGEVLFSTMSHNLVSYDPNSKRNRGLGIQGSPHSFYVQNYRESLSLLNGNSVISGRVLERIGNDWLP